MRVVHALVATDPQNPRIDHDDWNAEHNVEEATETATADDTITAGESGKVFFNTGAASLVTLTLPAAADKLKFTFIVTDTSGLAVTAADTIQVGGTSANTFTCTQLGGSLTLYGFSGGWVASSSQRTWIDS